MFWHKSLTAIQEKSLIKGWAIIRRMCRDDENRRRFVRFVEMLETGNDQRRALETAFGMSPNEIDDAWKKWINCQRK